MEEINPLNIPRVKLNFYDLMNSYGEFKIKATPEYLKKLKEIRDNKGLDNEKIAEKICDADKEISRSDDFIRYKGDKWFNDTDRDPDNTKYFLEKYKKENGTTREAENIKDEISYFFNDGFLNFQLFKELLNHLKLDCREEFERKNISSYKNGGTSNTFEFPEITRISPDAKIIYLTALSEMDCFYPKPDNALEKKTKNAFYKRLEEAINSLPVKSCNGNDFKKSSELKLFFNYISDEINRNEPENKIYSILRISALLTDRNHHVPRLNNKSVTLKSLGEKKTKETMNQSLEVLKLYHSEKDGKSNIRIKSLKKIYNCIKTTGERKKILTLLRPSLEVLDAVKKTSKSPVSKIS